MKKLRLVIVLLAAMLIAHGISNTELFAQKAQVQPSKSLMIANSSKIYKVQNKEFVSLDEMLSTLERHFDVTFLFKEEVVANKFVDVNKIQVGEKTGEELSKIINELELAFERVDEQTYVLLSQPSTVKEEEFVQEEVTGTVTDAESGETLPGVNVMVKGTSTGTATDANGEFQLTVESLQDTLIVSFIGYKTQEIPIDGRSELSISMQLDAISGDEVVVTGYSIKRQSELSSSVSVVDEQQLQASPLSENLGTMLQGKIAGVTVSNSQGEPGSGTDVVIRGVGSIGAGSSPLYVVDGVIGDGDNVNPSDISSITVLKDAAATGIYGSRASNGVIVITTKKGEAGETKVNYSGSFGVSQHRDFETMNSAELYGQYKMGYENFYNDRVAAGDPSFTNLSFDDYLSSVLPSSLLDRDTPWNSMLTRTGYVNQHQISVSGGDESTRFYVSGKYFDELGTLLGTEFQEMNLRANLEHQISDKFSVQARINAGTEIRPNDPVGGQGSARNQYYNNMPWDPAYEEDGITPYNPLESGNEWFGNASSNYFYNVEHQSSETKNANFDADIQLDADITEWLTFSTKNRVGISGQDFFELVDKRHQDGISAGGIVTQSYNYGNTFLTSNVFNFSHSFDNHNFGGVLGQEYNYLSNLNTGASGSDIAIGLSAIDAAGSPRSVSGGVSSETGFSSFFGQLDYDYQRRYFLVGSLRYDASSRFGANNRWANFFSIGGSWIVSNEKFLDNSAWIDILKLRASYGTTGNANIAPYLSMGTYVFSSNTTYNGSAGAQPARLPNPDLTWEKAYTSNIGLELSFIERITLEVDVYNRENKDLLQSVPLSSVSGFASQQRNVGSVRNRGVDISLHSLNFDKEVRWETIFNININRNKVLGLHDGADIGSGNYRISEGLTRRHFYMRDWAGVDPETGDPLWVRWEDEKGNRIDGGDHQEPANIVVTNEYNNASNLFIGSAYPDFTGGIQNEIYYRNFSFRVISNYSVGQQIYFAHRMRIDSDGAHMAHNEIKRHDDWVRWEKPGDDATHPRMIAGGNKNSNQQSSRYLEDGSYFRIQNVNLGYTFNESFLGFSRLRLHASVDNPVVFTNFSGGDPDISIESGVINQGANSRYSPTRKVIFGINLEF